MTGCCLIIPPYLRYGKRVGAGYSPSISRRDSASISQGLDSYDRTKSSSPGNPLAVLRSHRWACWRHRFRDARTFTRPPNTATVAVEPRRKKWTKPLLRPIPRTRKASSPRLIVRFSVPNSRISNSTTFLAESSGKSAVAMTISTIWKWSSEIQSTEERSMSSKRASLPLLNVSF